MRLLDRSVPLEVQKRRDGTPLSLRFLLDQIPLLALIVVCLATALLSNRFLTGMNLTNILLQASVMSVVAMGMTFVIISGGFDLSVGSIVAMSGCVAAWVMLETNVVFGVLAGIGVGAGIGFINGKKADRVEG